MAWGTHHYWQDGLHNEGAAALAADIHTARRRIENSMKYGGKGVHLWSPPLMPNGVRVTRSDFSAAPSTEALHSICLHRHEQWSQQRAYAGGGRGDT